MLALLSLPGQEQGSASWDAEVEMLAETLVQRLAGKLVEGRLGESLVFGVGCCQR